MKNIFNNGTIDIKNNKKLYTINSSFKTGKSYIIDYLSNVNLNLFGYSDDYTYTFNANSVLSLSQVMENVKNDGLQYHEVSNYLYNIYDIIEYLENNKKTVISLDIDDFIVIDREKIIFINEDKIVDIEKNDQIIIKKPIQRNTLISPELKLINKLPYTINHKQVYFNIGMLIYYMLFDSLLDTANIYNDVKMNLIKETSIYWFLHRCLEKDVNKRTLLLI